MPLPDRLELAGLLELVMSKFADRLQHRESRLALARYSDPHQRLIPKGGKAFKRVERRTVQMGNRFCRFKGPAPAEDGDLREQTPLIFRQEVVAPRDGRT